MLVSTPRKRVGRDKKEVPFFGSHAPFGGTQEPKNGAAFESQIRSTEHLFRCKEPETPKTELTFKAGSVFVIGHGVSSAMLFRANQTSM